MAQSSKQLLREALLAARRRLPAEDRAVRSRLAAERVVSLEAFARARTVALYAPMGAEVDTADIASAAARHGKRVAYPRIDARDRVLAFASCSPDELVPGGFRSREPPATAPVIPLSAIDLIVVPGVAFDPRCRRLGRGRGHYDATLVSLDPAAARIGLAFELQIVAEVPEEPHDAPLDAVVTESRIVLRLPDRVTIPNSSH
jgi:5-formyltetrahydrofolate cyclo-ligase